MSTPKKDPAKIFIREIGAFLATAGIILTISMAAGYFAAERSSTEIIDKQIEAISSELDELSGETKLLVESLRKDSSADSDSLSQVIERLRYLESETETLRQSLSGIEQALGNNLEKSLSLPILRKDVENLSSLQAAEIGALRNELSSVKAMVTFLSVTLGGLVVAVIGPIIVDRLRSKSPKNDREDNET